MNLAVGAAFIFSIILPGRWLIELMVGGPAFQSTATLQKGLALAVVEYWLPAVLFYVLLRSAKDMQFRITRGETIVLAAANLTLILYVCARVLASTVEGGGASFVVISIAMFTAMPALVALGVVLFKIALSLVRRRAAMEAQRRFSRLEIGAVALIGLFPALSVLAGLFVGEESPFQVGRAVKERMQQLCSTAGERLEQRPHGVEGVYLSVDGAQYFWNVSNGVYGAYGSSSVGDPMILFSSVAHLKTNANFALTRISNG